MIEANDERLRRTLEIDEDNRTEMYRCPTGHLTIGIGHNLEAHGIPEEAVELIYRADVQNAIELASTLRGWENCDAPRQRVLVEMVFQMGVRAVRGFVRMQNALVESDFAEAAREMLDSEWYMNRHGRGTPTRARRAAERMLAGVDDDR